MHALILHQDRIRDAADHIWMAGQVGLLNGWGVFSTLRVIDGMLFAWERHWRRMQRDAALLHVPFPDDPTWMEAQLGKLVEANQAWNATLRVAVVRNRGGQFEGPGIARDFDVIAFTKDLANWGGEARLDVAEKARHADHEFAGTKMLSWSFNLVYLERAQARGFDEVVMLNERGEVSECTSANIFAVLDGRVVTPPLSSGCLPGVTRGLLLEEIEPSAEERPLRLADLEAASEIFITSSTRDVLPVSAVGGLPLRLDPTRPVTRRLRSAFQAYLAAYAAERRNRAALVAKEAGT
jgi:branched-chain amino acid aminotransferase